MLDCVHILKLKNHNELFGVKAAPLKDRALDTDVGGGVERRRDAALGCFFALSFSNSTRVSNLRQNNKWFARDKIESTEARGHMVGQ